MTSPSHPATIRTTLLLVLAALLYCHPLSSLGGSDGLPPHIKRLILTENYSALYQELQPLVEANHSEAQYQLGLLYLHGRGIDPNKNSALYWFETAAIDEHSKALFNSAMIRLERDPMSETAIDYLEKAAKLGHRMSEKRLAAIREQTSRFGSNENSTDRELIFAVKEKNIPLVKALLKGRADINTRDSDGKTVLMIAIEKSSHPLTLELALELLAMGIDADAQDNLGNTATHYAVRSRKPALLSVVAKSASPNLRNKQGITPLWLAVSLKYAKAVNILLAANANINDPGFKQQTPLQLAESRGYREIGKILQNNGAVTQQTLMPEALSAMQAELKKPQYQGWTILMLAAWLGNAPAVNHTLNNTEGNRDTLRIAEALALAIDGEHREVAVQLTTHALKNNITADKLEPLLEGMIKNGLSEAFQLSYQHLKNLANRREITTRLLWWSVVYNHEESALYLIADGAPVNFIASGGSSCLTKAAENGAIATTGALLEKGSDINHTDRKSRTALWHASNNQHIELVKYLLNTGSDANIADNNGHTPLIRAIYHNNAALVRHLLSVGAKPDTITENGNTALMIAAERSSPQIVRQLTGVSENVAARNNNSMTALMLASKRGNAAVVKMLLQAGANPQRKNRAGHNARDLARTEDIARLMKQ